MFTLVYFKTLIGKQAPTECLDGEELPNSKRWKIFVNKE